MIQRRVWLAIVAGGALAVSCGASGRAVVADPTRQPPPPFSSEHKVAREIRVATDPDMSDPFRTAADRADRVRLTGDDVSDPDGELRAARRSSARAGEAAGDVEDSPSAFKGPPGTSRPRSPRDGAARPKPGPAASGESLFDADLGLEDLTARPVALKSWAGKLTIVNVWATWCGPCRVETPELVKLAKDLAPRGVSLVGVALDADAVEVRAFMRSYGIEYPMGIGRKKFVSAMGDLGVEVHGVPLTVLLDAEGRVLERYTGLIHRAALEADVERYLK